jgi:hypothetical protein
LIFGPNPSQWRRTFQKSKKAQKLLDEKLLKKIIQVFAKVLIVPNYVHKMSLGASFGPIQKYLSK